MHLRYISIVCLWLTLFTFCGGLFIKSHIRGSNLGESSDLAMCNYWSFWEKWLYYSFYGHRVRHDWSDLAAAAAVSVSYNCVKGKEWRNQYVSALSWRSGLSCSLGTPKSQGTAHYIEVYSKYIFMCVKVELIFFHWRVISLKVGMTPHDRRDPTLCTVR